MVTGEIAQWLRVFAASWVVVVAQAFNPNTQEAEAGGSGSIFEFEDNLAYRVSE